ncbi:MAG: D-glucuronyl C5-epimerase family protein [candidate division KSB1 bacterium]|nr:D-glucuronyl C5-epimerase family protein [candidate division KSB1 bacterium]
MRKLDLSYPVRWEGLENFSYDFDAEGIPRVQYGPPIGLRYNAITTAQWGLYNLQRWVEKGADAALQTALRCADWLVANCRPWKNEALAWIYEYGFPLYGPFPPWISAMAQGEAISLLLRCCSVNPKEDYLRVSRAAVRVFLYDYAEGGVAAPLADGTVFFQEYPVEPPVHVLNGGIFALLGVYDYAVFFDDQEMRALVHHVVDGLKRRWRDWDLGFWTRYDLYRIPRAASPMYQELHARLFDVLGDLFNEDEFKAAAKRWRRQLRNPAARLLRLGFKLQEKVRLAGARR